MALEPNDPIPHGITPEKAYTAIKAFYQGNRALFTPENNPPRNLNGDLLPGRKHDDLHIESMLKTLLLIDKLPEYQFLSIVDLKAVFRSVISGRLEVGYHKSDGQYKMAAYSHAALKTMTGDDRYYLTETEEQQIQNGSIADLVMLLSW
jgi:hypothetical protein